jgi:SAM-dependent methyltransferase
MFDITRHIYKGQSLARILMNRALRKHAISGIVLDIGGARKPDYFKYLVVKEGTIVITVDMMEPEGSKNKIDFEKDKLPYSNSTIDQALMFNILEHIYNHQFLVNEAYRVLKPGSKLLGFVPFLINYHPDPHDYFRYTKESLRRILSDAGFKNIVVTEVARGPFAVNYNNIILSVPRIIRVLLLPIAWTLDTIFLKFRPQIGTRYPLGYLFEGNK